MAVNPAAFLPAYLLACGLEVVMSLRQAGTHTAGPNYEKQTQI